MEFSGRENHASAFTADGNRFAFFTVDTINFPLTEKAIPNTPPFQRCVAWIYDLMSSTLTPVNQSEEPYACESTAIAWDGSTFHTNSFPYINPQTRSPPVAERVTAQNSTVLPPTSLPKAVQDQFALDAAETTAAENLAYPGTSQQTANSLSYGAPRAAETVALSS
jgi:hypothetical protein